MNMKRCADLLALLARRRAPTNKIESYLSYDNSAGLDYQSAAVNQNRRRGMISSSLAGRRAGRGRTPREQLLTSCRPVPQLAVCERYSMRTLSDALKLFMTSRAASPLVTHG